MRRLGFTLSSGLIVVFSLLLSAQTAGAKDLTNRLGVGFADPFGMSRGLPSVAAQYYPNAELGVMGSLGVDTQTDNSQFGFMTKIFRVVFMEENMNFYMGAGVGLLSQEVGSTTNSGFELNGFVGGEYFFSGLESLGFSFEAGIGVTSVSDEVRFRTIGQSPLRAGILFYF